jgi:hypothetical protein
MLKGPRTGCYDKGMTQKRYPHALVNSSLLRGFQKDKRHIIYCVHTGGQTKRSTNSNTFHAKSWTQEGTVLDQGLDNLCQDDILLKSLSFLLLQDRQEQERHLLVNQLP